MSLAELGTRDSSCRVMKVRDPERFPLVIHNVIALQEVVARSFYRRSGAYPDQPNLIMLAQIQQLLA
ncbi:hypothetical protein D3C81_2055260 [compost metagenome]